MNRTRRQRTLTPSPTASARGPSASDDQAGLGNAAALDRLGLTQTADGHPIHDGDVLIPTTIRGDGSSGDASITPRNASRTPSGADNPDFVGPARPPLNPYDSTVTDHSIPLFDERGPNYDDPEQGGLGDCYLIASLSAVAQQDPGRIRRMIRPMPDGRYVVTFWVAATEGGLRTFNPHDEIVENAVPSTSPSRVPEHAGTGSAPDPYGIGGGRMSQRELWVSLVERAYAQWRGGYELAGAGGTAAAALEEITGIRSRILRPGSTDPGEIVDTIERELRAHSAIVAGTVADDAIAMRHGLIGAHGYSVLSAGSGQVLLRNQQRDPNRGGRRITIGTDAVREAISSFAISPVAGTMTAQNARESAREE